jgi:putative protease
MPVYENERGTYIFNSKDLCMIEHLPDLMEAGIDSLKVEGRMKTALYVASVARTYRKALNDLAVSEEQYRRNMEWYKEEIGKCTTRKFTTGFFYGKPDSDTQIYDNNTYTQDYIYLGIAGDGDGEGRFGLEQRNKFSVGEQIEIMKPDGRNISVTVEEIRATDGTEQESAPHPKQKLWVRLSEMPEKYDILRRRV